MQTRRKRNGESKLPSLLAYLQEANVLIGAAQEDIQTQLKGGLASFTVQCTFARMRLWKLFRKFAFSSLNAF